MELSLLWSYIQSSLLFTIFVQWLVSLIRCPSPLSYLQSSSSLSLSSSSPCHLLLHLLMHLVLSWPHSPHRGQMEADFRHTDLAWCFDGQMWHTTSRMHFPLFSCSRPHQWQLGPARSSTDRGFMYGVGTSMHFLVV